MKPKPVGIPRCKDCVYCELRTGYSDRYKCNYWHNTVSKDDFCSRGVKRNLNPNFKGKENIMIAMPPKEIEESIRKIKDTHVYCTHCKHFRLDDEEIPYCPWEDRCNINDCEDSRPYSERPFYEERKEDFMKQELHNKYIKSDKQHIIYNDGAMISWWTIVDGNCIEIHQSDLETDNCVFVTIEDFVDIANLISVHKKLL